MSYRDLLAGLIYEGESFQAMNQFTFMNYTHVQFSDENFKHVSQRSGGICLLTNKRILFLSSQLAVGRLIFSFLELHCMRQHRYCMSHFDLILS